MKQVHDLRSQGSYLEPRPLTLIAYVVLSKALVSVTKPLVLETVANMTDKATLQLLARREYVRMLSEPGMQDTVLVSKHMHVQWYLSIVDTVGTA